MHPARIRGLKMKKIVLALVAVICFGCAENTETNYDLKTSENVQSNYDFKTSKFVLLVENTENGIKFTSTQGCAFKELSFSLIEGQTQEIDQHGMRKANDEVVEDDNLASFRFKIKKTKDGLAFEGIEGTTWRKLSFSCPINTSQLINQNGML